MCVLSAIPGGQLLSFACPKESNQRKRHPRIRALAYGEGSLRANGFRPQGLLPCCRNRRDPSRRPRAAHAADPSALRRFSEGPKSKERSKASAAGTAALGSSRVPSRPRRAGGGIVARSAVAGRRPASSTRVHGRTPGEPRSLLAQFAGHGCPANRGREGAFFFGYFLLGKQKKVTRPPGWRSKKHRDVRRHRSGKQRWRNFHCEMLARGSRCRLDDRRHG